VCSQEADSCARIDRLAAFLAGQNDARTPIAAAWAWRTGLVIA
jgi:hypothetical protein